MKKSTSKSSKSDSITLIVPLRTPSLNDLIKLHWATYRNRHQKPWVKAVRDQVYEKLNGKPPMLAKCYLRVERYSKVRISDYDNAQGGLKPVIDALCKNGIIIDDNDRVILGTTLVQIRSGIDRTIIKVTPA